MPTIKQKIAAKKTSDFIRNSGGKTLNMGRILRESGYSESVSKKPSLVTNSPSYQKMVEEQTKDLTLEVKIAHSFVLHQYSNLNAKMRAVDLYYKVTGAYKHPKETPESDHRQKEIDEALDRLATILPKHP